MESHRKRLAIDRGNFEQEILAAYEGELLGGAFFSEMSRHYRTDLYAKRAFLILSEVERVTGHLMRDLLTQHAVPINSPGESATKGVAVAEAFKSLAWDALIEQMGRRITPALAGFEALLAHAPRSASHFIELLLEHERALDAFVQFGTRRTNGALRPCLSYLRRVRALNPQAY